MPESVFLKLSDDLLLIILFKLEDDPVSWARIACVATRFSFLIRSFCYRTKCLNSIPAVVADLPPSSAAASGVWASLHKISVCCPGLLHCGVLLENSDFGLERELGPEENYRVSRRANEKSESILGCSSSNCDVGSEFPSSGEISWSLYDDLLFDTLYSEPEEPFPSEVPEIPNSSTEINQEHVIHCPVSERSCGSHLASGSWNLSREEGNKLLETRFKGDSLYICGFPGCVHVEEKRNYMLFRGFFKKFKESSVWRTINDGKRRQIDVSCAFCSLKQTWDLHSSFCLRKYFGFRDDGEPVVRAYVCENGHVSGAWTDSPLFN